MVWYIVLLEYLKVLVSWPVITLAVSLLFVNRFDIPIRQFLGRLVGLRVGNTEFTAQQPVPVEDTDLTARENQLMVAFVRTTLDLARVQQSSEQGRNLALLWEFRYLELFLVPVTKATLILLDRELPEDMPPTLDEFRSMWVSMKSGGDKERDAVLMALINTGLLEQRGNQLSVTLKGKAFLQFMRHTVKASAGQLRP